MCIPSPLLRHYRHNPTKPHFSLLALPMSFHRNPQHEQHPAAQYYESPTAYRPNPMNEYGSTQFSDTPQSPQSHSVYPSEEAEYSANTNLELFHTPTRTETWASCDYTTERDSPGRNRRNLVSPREDSFDQGEIEYAARGGRAPMASVHSLEYTNEGSTGSVPRRHRHGLGLRLRERIDSVSTRSSTFSSILSSTISSPSSSRGRGPRARVEPEEWSPEEEETIEIVGVGEARHITARSTNTC